MSHEYHFSHRSSHSVYIKSDVVGVSIRMCSYELERVLPVGLCVCCVCVFVLTGAWSRYWVVRRSIVVGVAGAGQGGSGLRVAVLRTFSTKAIARHRLIEPHLTGCRERWRVNRERKGSPKVTQAMHSDRRAQRKLCISTLLQPFEHCVISSFILGLTPPLFQICIITGFVTVETVEQGR